MNPENAIFTEKYRPKLVSEIVGDFKDKILKYLRNSDSIPHFLFYSKVPGTGKCLGKDTSILMFDGSIKMVQDIENGDELMGPDSKLRIVKGVTKGKSNMYKVIQKYGDDYIINKDHILSLKSSHKKGKIFNVPVEEYLMYTDRKQIDLKGYKCGVDFSEKKINIHPYWLGLWLGDGCSRDHRIANPDLEIIKYLDSYTKEFNYTLKNHCSDKTRCPYWSMSNKKNEKNIFLEFLRDYDLIDNKHIPNDYLLTSKKNRLSLLAGLIDTDGYVTCSCYEIIQKSERLAKHIIFLARSLGFRATIRKKTSGIKTTGFVDDYYRIFISGDVWKIPVKLEKRKILKHKRQKDALRYGIEVEDVGEGEYYGFTVGSDGLFMLGDFTVTHNTSLAKAIINELGCDYLIINSSDERKIDVVREKVKEFAMSQSKVPDKRKCIFLDEFDGMTHQSQDALRNILETYASNVFFILTCNNINKVIDPLRSRCVQISFAYPKKVEIAEYLRKICIAEKIEYNLEGLQALIELNYPSIRNCVLAVQDMFTEEKSIIPENVKAVNQIYEDMWKLLMEKRWRDIKKVVLESTLDARDLNSYFWEQALKEDKKKIIQITCMNEKDISWGADSKIIFVTSLIEMSK